MSTSFASALLRLRTVPWESLSGHLPPLLQTLEKVLAGAPAAQMLAGLLKERSLSGDAQARQGLAEAVFGIALWRRLLAHYAGLQEPTPEEASRLLYVLLTDLGQLPPEVAGELSGLRANERPTPRPPPTSLAVQASVPDWLADTVTAELKDEAEAFFATINVPGPIFLRAQVGRISRETLAARLKSAEENIQTRPTRYSPWGLEVLSPRPNIYGSKAYQEGLFEVQDEGSQLLGLLLDVQPEDDVLDYCAGAGGKTLLFSSLLKGKARLHAYDVDVSRLERLERRVEKARGHPVRIHWTPPPADLQVDRVLVDAPCSELGALRRGPDVRFRLDPASFDAFPPLQSQILERAAQHVRPGGHLLYATCTLRSAENAQVVDAFLRTRPDFRVTRPQAPCLPEDAFQGGYVCLLPHRHGTDGFFAALMTRAVE